MAVAVDFVYSPMTEQAGAGQNVDEHVNGQDQLTVGHGPAAYMGGVTEAIGSSAIP